MYEQYLKEKIMGEPYADKDSIFQEMKYFMHFLFLMFCRQKPYQFQERIFFVSLLLFIRNTFWCFKINVKWQTWVKPPICPGSQLK